MKRTRSGTVYDATEDDDGADEVVQSGGDYDDEDDDEEDIRAAAEKPKTFTQRLKANAKDLELPAVTQLGFLCPGSDGLLRACLQDLLTKQPALAADVAGFCALRRPVIDASLRQQQQQSLTQLRALTELNQDHRARFSKSRFEALTLLTTTVRDRALQLSAHDLPAALEEIATFMGAFRKNFPREADLRSDALIRVSRSVETLLFPLWARLLAAAESARGIPAKAVTQHVERAVACDVNGHLPLEGKLAKQQLQQLVRGVAAARDGDELVKRLHAAAKSLGHPYSLYRWDEALPDELQAFADKVLRELRGSDCSDGPWPHPQATLVAALLRHMDRWDELCTLADSKDVSGAWVLEELLLPPKVFSNPDPRAALAYRRPQFALNRAQLELLNGCMDMPIRQLRKLMDAGMMDALQEAWDEDDNEATSYIIQEHIDSYAGDVLDYDMGKTFAGWLECAEMACTNLQDAEGSTQATAFASLLAHAGLGGDAIPMLTQQHASGGPPTFESFCSLLRDAAKGYFNTEEERQAMRDIVSVRHCDFDGRWYGSVWPGVFAAVDGLLGGKFDLYMMKRQRESRSYWW